MNYFWLVDTVGKRKRSEIMANGRSRGNASTELKALKIMRQNGIKGWRRHFPIFDRPDFAFPKTRIALFIDGCFWHGCPRCYRAPKSSCDYWRQKITRNKKTGPACLAASPKKWLESATNPRVPVENTGPVFMLNQKTWLVIWISPLNWKPKRVILWTVS
jgi:DNA mismatch endonuclease (patch repair protein)